MVATIALPRVLSRWIGKGAPSRRVGEDTDAAAPSETPARDPDEERAGPYDLALLIGIGVASLWAATALSDWSTSLGLSLPMMLVLTALALALGQLPWARRLRGMNMLGMFAVYLFLAVIGAFCDLSALASLGRLGLDLSLFAAIVLLVHGVVTFGGSHMLGYDADAAAIASQANIGGGTTALAVARSLGRPELVLPAILVGSIGTATGTFVGFFVAGQLAP
jgi:uncharacterized membrane protein